MSDDVTPFVPDGRLVFEATDAMTGKRTRLETVAPVTEYAIGHELIVGDPSLVWSTEPPRVVGAKLTVETTLRKLDSDPTGVLFRAVEIEGEHAHAHLAVPAADLKMLRETLAAAQSAIDDRHEGERAHRHNDRLQQLIDEIDRHRPLGADGTHGDRHTLTCGCEDR